ncbi:MAG: dienelactone hydrolase family protein [Phenylobacterium sp.]|uniref:dienelactone hydrolase family protein n=1 Tax=Phenylobacterium sp. TaxID=1871053 RepID=UPI00391B6A0B
MGDLSNYACSGFSDGRWTRPVYRRGQGPAVIVIHELPGLHPLVVDFADRIVAAGMSAWCPSLFGEPGRPVDRGYMLGEALKAICIRREFHVWAKDASSPIVDWLRALARQAHAECGGQGVGAVGMCFTGGFALAMMTEPAVVAPVVAQPSLPLIAGSKARAASIGASPQEIACARARFEDEDLSMIGLRFKSDKLVGDARFDRYRAEFGARFEAIEFEDADAAPADVPPHSTLTLHLRADGPTAEAADRVIAFFRRRTGA